VAWAFTGKPPARAPLGAVAKRDSALQMQRVDFVLDSLDKAGANRIMTGMIRKLATTGDLTPLMQMFGGSRGSNGFGAPAPWNDRPGEQGVRRAATATQQGNTKPDSAHVGAPAGAQPAKDSGATHAGADAAASAAMVPPDPSQFEKLIDLFQIPGRPAAGGGFGGLSFLQNLGFGNLFAAFGGSGNAAAPGDYVVSMTVDGKTLRQRLHVERGMPANP
jgi:hypothetical protein